MGRWRQWLGGERGTATAAMVLLFAALLGSGSVLMLIGRATILRAEAVTAADAAALAAAEDLRRQLTELVHDTAFDAPTELDYESARAAAADYAARNGAELVAFTADGLDVRVETATRDSVGRYEFPELGGRAMPEIDASDQRGTARARALVELDGGGSRSGPNLVGGNPVQGAVPAEDLAAVAAALGIPEVPAYSALRMYDGDGYSPTPSVRGLTPEMQQEIVKIELALGRQLVLSSAYRSEAGQARVCAQVRAANPNALCAPPGRSLHQAGLAIDTPNPGDVLEAMRRDPSIQLCQPYPSNDAVHFSHSSGRECSGRQGGTTGGGGGTGAGGGTFATYTVRLAPLPAGERGA